MAAAVLQISKTNAADNKNVVAILFISHSPFKFFEVSFTGELQQS
jgi:hypothetical protein